MNPLVAELIALLPAGPPWPEADRERWVAAMTAVVHLVYAESTAPDPTYQGGVNVDLRKPRGRHARPQIPDQPTHDYLTDPGTAPAEATVSRTA